MALVCLTLTAPTIEENLKILQNYYGTIDLVELRADFLIPEEIENLRFFPERAELPSILTVRRKVDGGGTVISEARRLNIIAAGLAHSSFNKQVNFAYVDFEYDFRVTSIEDACKIFNTKIIRSYHCMTELPLDLDSHWNLVAANDDEIPKLAFYCKNAADTARLFTWAQTLPARDKIIVGMGPYGFPTRILADRIGSLLCYTSALNAGLPSAAPGHLDPELLKTTYNVRILDETTELYTVAGGLSVLHSRSPELHNGAFMDAGRNALYLATPATNAQEFLQLADATKLRGASITVPLKEELLPLLAVQSEEVMSIKACNTILRTEQGWAGFNTDALGFEKALLEFTAGHELKDLRTTIIGAGGAARAVAFVLAKHGVRALVINRSSGAARKLAHDFHLLWEHRSNINDGQFMDFTDLLINTTSLGMANSSPTDPNDPLEEYEFTGKELVFDLIYNPEETKFLERARLRGCKTCNGYKMLTYQAAEQFKIWTGAAAPSTSYE